MITGTPLNQEQLSRLSGLLADRCGLRIGDAQHPAVQAGLARLMASTGSDSFEAFFDRVGELRDQLAHAMISRETAWFREPECLNTIAQRLVPELEEDLDCGRSDRIRIWSAGCSTGQEPYSLVMAILTHLAAHGLGDRLPAHFEIVATDLAPAAIFLAVAGRYEARALREEGLPPDAQRRFFEPSGRVFSIRDGVRRSVRFRQHNLPDPADGLASGPFDIVLLRHVLEYYTDRHQREILASVQAAMSPAGVLFLGARETPPPGEKLRETPLQGCTCYRRQ